MKNKKIVILLIVIDIIIITGIYNFISKNTNIKKEKQIIKEMSESTQVAELNNQINALNAEHTDYMNYIQTCKTKIAEAITNKGVNTSSEATAEVMVENIEKIISESGKITQLTCLNLTSSSTSFYISNTYSHCYVIVSLAQVGGYAGNYYTPSVTSGTLIAQNSVAKSYDGIQNGEATYIFEITPATADSTITVSTGISDYYALGTVYVFVG